MIYHTIEHWYDFKQASGRSYKFSDEAFQVLFQHFYELSEWDSEGIEIHYELFNFIEEYDNAIQAIPFEVYGKIKDKLWKDNMCGLDPDGNYDELDYEPEDEEIEPLARQWLHDHYETVLDLPCCGALIVFLDSKKY